MLKYLNRVPVFWRIVAVIVAVVLLVQIGFWLINIRDNVTFCLGLLSFAAALYVVIEAITRLIKKGSNP